MDSLFYSYTAKITSDFLQPLILFFRLLHSPIDRLSILCALFPAPLPSLSSSKEGCAILPNEGEQVFLLHTPGTAIDPEVESST